MIPRLLSALFLLSAAGCPGANGAQQEPAPCGQPVFVSPTNGQTLNASDATSPAAGGALETRVVISSELDEEVELRVNSELVAIIPVAGGRGETKLVLNPAEDVRLAARSGRCGSQIHVRVDLSAPYCAVANPSKTLLNNVPAALGGDRVSDGSEPYAVRVEVETSAEDGQPVSLNIDGDELATAAFGGRAVFPNVKLTAGQHWVTPRCTDAAGNSTVGATRTYDVLLDPPPLSTLRPASGTVLSSFYDVRPTENGLQFEVCGSTPSTKASEFCATLSAGIHACAPLSNGEACVQFACPEGDAPLSVEATLSDIAGNLTRMPITGLQCAPGFQPVRITRPAFDSAGGIPILNASALDQGATPGNMLKTVIACSQLPGTARIAAGPSDAVQTQADNLVAQDSTQVSGAPLCPAGRPWFIQQQVLLPESVNSTDGSGSLVTSTELLVTFTASETGLSAADHEQLWVDSVPPQLSILSPLCGSTVTRDTVDVRLQTDSVFTSVRANSGTPHALNATTLPSLPADVVIPGVELALGANVLTAYAEDGAGNVTTAPPCTITRE